MLLTVWEVDHVKLGRAKGARRTSKHLHFFVAPSNYAPHPTFHAQSLEGLENYVLQQGGAQWLGLRVAVVPSMPPVSSTCSRQPQPVAVHSADKR